MAFTATSLIDRLAVRLRDPDNLGYPRATILNILNRAQRSLNANMGLVSSETTMSTSNTALYSVPLIAADVVRIIEIRDNERALTKVPWIHLVHQDPRWLRLKGEQPEVFANIGRTLLAIIPIPKYVKTLTVTYVLQTPDMLDDSSSSTVIPDEHDALLLDLTEAILLFRGREFEAMRTVLARLGPSLGIETKHEFDSRMGDQTRQ